MTQVLDGLREALLEVGITRGDTIFVHVSLDGVSPLGSQPSAKELLSVLQGVVSDEGTILVPTYTFSFCKQESFDVDETISLSGPWSASVGFVEHVRKLPGAIRSRDPIHSVAGVGPLADELLKDVPNTCFGAGSVHQRLLQAGGKIVTIGVGLHEATFRHHVEESIGVPFRYKKLFTGEITEKGRTYPTGWIYYVRILADEGYPDGYRLEALAKESGIARSAKVSGGEVTAVSCEDFHDLCMREITRDRWISARGPAGDPVELEERRVQPRPFELSVPNSARMEELVQSLWRLPRDIVSDGYDAALRAIGSQIPMRIHEYHSGSECWSWIVPEKWTCHEAYVETVDGKRLLTYADNPLHVISYSLPFEGVVSRETLLRHLHVHPHIPDAIPFVFKYYERDWGICCSRDLRDTLQDEAYRVVIRSSFSLGTLKVGEVVARGGTERCVVLCAHLCHPAMVNDDLSGVVVGLKVMESLLRRGSLRFTYRFLIVPETIGTVAFLSANEQLIPQMRGGLFLEMLGLDNPHALQMSFDGNTLIDRCFADTLMKLDPEAWTGPFRTIIGNDERQFNAPGIRVPMLSLSRVLASTHPHAPYREYHSSHDNLDCVSFERLEESVRVVLGLVESLESQDVPFNLYNGEPFCSRYGLHIDAYQNPEGHRALFDMLFLIDGSRTVAEIAEICQIPISAAEDTIRELRRFGLVGEEKVGKL